MPTRDEILRNIGLKTAESDTLTIYCNNPLMQEVVGAQRPRITTIGGKGRAYTAEKHRKALQHIVNVYSQQFNTFTHAADTRPVIVELYVQRKYPSSKPKKNEGEQDIFKPDIDNIAKLVLDGLNGLAYKDDSQVVGLVACKCPRIGTADFIQVRISYCNK